MPEMPIEAQPDLEELQQRDSEDVAVPVCVKEPVEVNILPSRVGQAFTHPLGSTPTRVLTNDLKRRRAVLLLPSATSTDTWRYTKTGATGSGFTWPANVPLVVEHCDDVYAASVLEGATSLSVLTETWAD